MPFYYDVTRATTTNGSADTLSTHLRAATVANQPVAKVSGIYVAGRDGTAGGGQVRVTRAGTIGSGGTAATENERRPDTPAAQTTWFDDTTAITAGVSPAVQLTIGFAQTGGMGGWVALEPDHAFWLLPNGAGDGNLEIGSLADGTSQNIDLTAEWSE